MKAQEDEDGAGSSASGRGLRETAGAPLDARLNGASMEAQHGPVPFWDAVVLTAADEAQAAGFRRQLEEQRQEAKLPRHCEYVGGARPDGRTHTGDRGPTAVRSRAVVGFPTCVGMLWCRTRLGPRSAMAGRRSWRWMCWSRPMARGWTLVRVVRSLAVVCATGVQRAATYHEPFRLPPGRGGAARLAVRVMVIHTGGYSKRLLHVSAVGKIFATMPVGKHMGPVRGCVVGHGSLHPNGLSAGMPRADGGLVDMLHLKLVMYIGVPGRMAPGVRSRAAQVALCARLY